MDASLQEFLRTVEQAWGRKALLYVGEDWEERYPLLERTDRPLRLVSLRGRPDHPWAVWQLHGFAHVDGVRGKVDLDVGRLERLSGR